MQCGEDGVGKIKRRPIALSDIGTFGIAGDWEGTALEVEVWVETVVEGGRRFMAAWRKEEVGAARLRQEKRKATRLGKL